MPQLPDERAYGARPSLDYSRLDRPHGQGVALADDVVQAATLFKGVLEAKAQKENQLNYALARNEIQQMDLEERNKLAEDLDWATHDQRYEDGFKRGREIVGEKYKLSPSDMEILDSEANLIRAQGRVQVGGRSRVLEVGEAKGRYETQKAIAREQVIFADEGTRNRMVLGQLEAIDAQEREGFMDPEEAALERIEVTQDFALGSLDNMPADQRARVIRASLRYRQGYGVDLGEHSDSFMRASNATGLSPELIHAVGSRESSLKASAVNPDSGAAGIMQLMEGTAGELGVTDRLDADQSIMAGAQYLAQQMERFGDPEAALAAYNWGPQNVQDAMDEYGDDWLSHAPKETRNYVAALADKWDPDYEIETNSTFDKGSGALTPDDIRNGLGTNSIADFVHGDTLAKMLELADKEDKTNVQRTDAQDITNRAFEIFPEDKEKRMEWIRNNSDGTVQNLAEEDARQRDSDEANAKLQVSTDMYEDMSQQMEAGELRFKNIPQEELNKMLPAHVDQLRERSSMLSYDKQWRDVSIYREPTKDDPEFGMMSMDEWALMDDFGRGGKTDQNLQTPLYWNSFTEKDHAKLVAEQDALKIQEQSRITTGALNPKAMVAGLLDRLQFTVEDDPDNLKFNSIRSRLEGELRRRILIQQNSTTPPTQIDEQAKNKILADIMAPYAFTDTDFFTTDYDMDEATPVWLMTDEQRNEAFINMDKANQRVTTIGGQELTTEMLLKKMGTDQTPKITGTSDHDMRRAAFALIHNIGGTPEATEAEVLRRLRGN